MISTTNHLRALIAVSMMTWVFVIAGAIAALFGEQTAIWIMTFIYIGTIGMITHKVISSLHKRVSELESRFAETESRDTH